MSIRVAYPFLTIPSDLVRFGGWMIGAPGEPLEPAPALLENWDYGRDLEIRAELELDLLAIADALSLKHDTAGYRAVMRVGTGAGTLPRRTWLLDLNCLRGSTSSAVLGGVAHGARLSSRLWLELGLLLEEGVVPLTPLAPATAGSRLWHTRADVLLEGGGESRFPIEAVSFSVLFRGQPQEHAPWYLDWQPGHLEEDFAGAVRLFLNSDQPEFVSRVVEGDPLTLQTILGDAMAQIVRGTLALDEVESALHECPDGTVGHQVRNWLAVAFSDQSFDSVRSAMDVVPGRFEAALLAAARFEQD